MVAVKCRARVPVRVFALRGARAGALALGVHHRRALFSEQALSEALEHADMAGPAAIRFSDGRCVRHLDFTHLSSVRRIEPDVLGGTNLKMKTDAVENLCGRMEH